MLRLANGDDTEFALSTGNRIMPCNPRKVQRALLRQCLRKLSADYSRLHAEAQSGPAQKIKFTLHVLRVRIQLALHTVAPHRIDLEPLLAHLERLAGAEPGMSRGPSALPVTAPESGNRPI